MRRNLDRFLLLGGLLAVASAVLLSAGLLAIFSALADDHVDLPSEGTLEDILRDAVDDGGIGLDGMGPSEVSVAGASAEPPGPATTPTPKPSPSPIPTPALPPPPPPAPVAIAIPRLDVAAAVVPMGLDADGSGLTRLTNDP